MIQGGILGGTREGMDPFLATGLQRLWDRPPLLLLHVPRQISTGATISLSVISDEVTGINMLCPPGHHPMPGREK